jgi:hypothetical protein
MASSEGFEKRCRGLYTAGPGIPAWRDWRQKREICRAADIRSSYVRKRSLEIFDHTKTISNVFTLTEILLFFLYGSTTFWTLAAFSVSESYTQSVGLLEWGISPSQGRFLHTDQHKHRINAFRHPCFEWDSNLKRSQCSSGRRQFMP